LDSNTPIRCIVSKGDEFTMTDRPAKKENLPNNNNLNDSFDSSYSNEIKDHLSKVNMDPWYYIYGNYVNPPSKKNKG